MGIIGLTDWRNAEISHFFYWWNLFNNVNHSNLFDRYS